MRLPWRKEVKVIFEPDEVEAFGSPLTGNLLFDLIRSNASLARNQLTMAQAYEDLHRAFRRLFAAFWLIMLVNTLYWIFGTPGAMETWRRCFGG
jgi:hypothetical protein